MGVSLRLAGEQPITAVNLTSSGVISSGPCVVRALHYVHGALAGSIVLKDGDSSGDPKITFYTPSSIDDNLINIPGGLVMTKACYATMTNVSGLTVMFY